MKIRNSAEYRVIGIMSGTSLDGLDIAECRFLKQEQDWSFSVHNAVTVPYHPEWLQKISSLEQAKADEFLVVHNEYGAYIGQRIADFIIRYDVKTDFIASHGHTIFHQPDKKMTMQIGAGQAIAAKCNMPVVCDFRSLDVALGGQGAPLVPIGDKLLFPQYQYCLNIGGFANISYEHNGNRIAYDICPANILLNEVAQRLGKPFDDKGNIARRGMVSNYLLNELNQLGYYKGGMHAPKSLGREWVLGQVHPLLEQYEVEDEDLLRTLCEHIATQVSRALQDKPAAKMLVTGGGAYNSFLVERISELSGMEIIIPEKKIIEYKEALIFAFLGVLRMRGEVNCLKTVTGAIRDNCGGAVYMP